MGQADASAVAAALAAQAGARGIRPPVSLTGADARAWIVLTSGGPSRAGDALLLDEYGELWWARPTGKLQARVVRSCWPEEASLCMEAIKATMDSVLGLPAYN